MKGGGLDDLDVPDAGEEVGDGLDVPVGHLVLKYMQLIIKYVKIRFNKGNDLLCI